MTFDPVSSLDSDWQQLARGVLRERLRVWAREETALAAFREPARLIQFLRGPASAAAKDELLRPLVRIARSDALAGRVLLEALMPGLKHLAERVIFDERDRDELWALILGHAWQQIRTYPLQRRPRKIAANLILETRHHALADFTRERRRRRDELPPRPLSAPASPPASTDIEALISKAVAAGAIAVEEAALILQTRIDGLPLAELAAARNVPYDTIRMRRRRAERRLLLFFGQAAVRFGGRKAHCSSARAVGTTHTGHISATPEARG